MKALNSSKWTLDVLYKGEWGRVAEKPSADACKSVARQFRESAGGDVVFRLYDPQGRLYAIAWDNDSWRMKWMTGNMLPREKQADRIVGVKATAAPPHNTKEPA